MLDPELRELTASEPLSLEEEHDMQRKWAEDSDSQQRYNSMPIEQSH